VKNSLSRSAFKIGVIFILIAVLALTPVSAGGGTTAGPWRDINPTQFLTAGDATAVPGPDVPFNGIYVRTAGFGSVGAGEAWAVGGCGPTGAGPPAFPFSGGATTVPPSGCSAAGATPPGGGTISYYDGFSWRIIGDPYSGQESFYAGVNFCTSPGSPGVGLCSPNGDGSDGWIVGGTAGATTKGQVALYVTGPGAVSEDSSGLNTATGYLTSVFEVCHVDNDPNGKNCPSGTPGDAYAVGTDGTHGVIYQYAGGAPSVGAWSLMFTSATATIYNGIYMYIDSNGKLEGFAVGDAGVIARFFGTWTDSVVGTATTTFHGVAVDNANPTEAWAVGYDSTPKGGVIYHYSTGIWSGPLSPSPVDGVVLESVDMLSTSEGWIVGTESTILHGTNLPGSNFISLSTAGSNVLDSGTGVGIDLNSVNFQSSGNGWAVGTEGVILQTSDSSCGSIVQTSSPSACWGGQTSIEQTTFFRAVYEIGQSDAWAGGLYDSVNSFPSLIHWDGNKWHRATVVPGLGGVTKPDIFGIFMSGGGEGYAVGSQAAPGATCGQSLCPAAFTYNSITSNTWQSVKVNQCSVAAGCGMTSVYFASIGPYDGWAVGTSGAFWTYSKSNPAWTGYPATVAPVPPATVPPNLNAIFINNPGNNNPAGWAVGDLGTILYLNCNSAPCVWTQTSIPGLPCPGGVCANLEGIYFSDSNHGWIVGSDNTIITTINNGGLWSVGSAAGASATAVWRSVHVDNYGTPSGSGDGWAVGDDGTGPPANALTAWFNGGGWTQIAIPMAVTSGLALYSVYTTSPTDGWAVGAQPSTGVNPLTGIFHLDPVVPPTYNGGSNSTSTTSATTASSTSPVTITVSSSTSSSVSSTVTSSATTQASASYASTSTSPSVTTVVSTAVSTMTVESTPTAVTSSTSSVSTPLALPAIPGFPWESIIAGLIFGLVALAVVRRVKKVR